MFLVLVFSPRRAKKPAQRIEIDEPAKVILVLPRLFNSTWTSWDLRSGPTSAMVMVVAGLRSRHQALRTRSRWFRRARGSPLERESRRWLGVGIMACFL